MLLAFKLGPIPVRIHAWFVIVAALLGLTINQSPLDVVLWSFAVVIAVFAHELGHAMAARAFGVAASVDLTPFAPTTERLLTQLTLLSRIIVALAGPTVSIALGTLATLARHRLDSGNPAIATAINHFAWINLSWGFLNLAPMLPFDGGHVLLALADRVTHGRGEQPIRLASAALALIVAVVALLAHLAFPALLCGIVAFQNARGLRAREAERREALARAHVMASFAAVERGDAAVGIAHCTAALRVSTDAGVRKDAVRLLAYAYATTGAWRHLLELLESGGATAMDDSELERFERAARELGRVDEAQRIARFRWPQPQHTV